MKKRICGLAAALTAGVCLCTGLSLPASAVSLDELGDYSTAAAIQLNRVRAFWGIKPFYTVSKDSALAQATLKRAMEYLTTKSDTRPDGSDWSTVLDEYNVPCNEAVEYRAYGYDDPKDMVNACVKSPSLLEDILNEDYEFVYVAASSHEYDSVVYCITIIGNSDDILDDAGFVTTQGVTGDADYDSVIDINDAFMTLRAYSMVSAGAELPMCNLQQQNCDIDGDGSITLQDALNILTYYSYASAGKSIQWSDLL